MHWIHVSTHWILSEQSLERGCPCSLVLPHEYRLSLCACRVLIFYLFLMEQTEADLTIDLLARQPVGQWLTLLNGSSENVPNSTEASYCTSTNACANLNAKHHILYMYSISLAEEKLPGRAHLMQSKRVVSSKRVCALTSSSRSRGRSAVAPAKPNVNGTVLSKDSMLDQEGFFPNLLQMWTTWSMIFKAG